ncbi:exonuclease domain-containing protein [Stratiformator vulcanicus]|uniref:DNA polymerase III PolC-type n=1 Tax=Stratiformator vulcanicus TaxID=2527980 RepID=A0A517QZA8_9PLAN|nr:exonuclease domain-containing protein [Stratiformator vulcanicus]QDT36986.1 DNA polymerase III PolC-type [Stratiformator vulcanicus]
MRELLSQRSLGDIEFVAFDLETTGCSAAFGEIVEVGAVRFRADGTELGRFEQLVNPGREIPPEVIRVHGITDAMVVDAPAIDDVLPQLIDFFGSAESTILMAHNAAFDVGFVSAALAKTSTVPPVHQVIDSVRLARRRFRGLPSYSLKALTRAFAVTRSSEHRGLDDSLALKEVFLNLTALPPQPRLAADLLALSPSHHFSAQIPQRRPYRPARSSRSRVVDDSDLPAEARGIADAISSGARLSIVYDGGSRSGCARSVTPLEIIRGRGASYLLAFCHRDGKRKQYRLDRILEYKVEADADSSAEPSRSLMP